MEFWGCDSEGFEYDLLSEDGELDLAVVDGSQSLFEFDLDMDSPLGLEQDVLFLDKRVMERFQEVESGLSDILREPKETGINVENLGEGDGIFSGDDMNLASPDCGLSSFSLPGENENDSWSGNSSLSALNFEKGRQEGEPENDEISEKRFEASMADLSTLDKQAHSECLSSTKVTCQVQGCNADLTSSKDYYKRHRVCPLDTKKAEVIVNGIQKRFCQQCSRFHLLNEFDDDKRSCRKRLAGHNKRRRKPRFEKHNHRPHRFQPFQCQGVGTRPHEAPLPPRRHLLTDLLPARVLFPDFYEHINESRFQGSSVYRPTQANIPAMQNSCPGCECYSQPIRSSAVQKSSGVLDASHALSLLSNQPQFSSPYFTTTSPVIIQGHNIFHNPANKVSFSSPHTHMFHASGMGLLQAYQIDPRLLHGTITPVSSMANSVNHGGGSLCSNCSNCHMPRQNGSTVDLQQLSFNLSRVENQRSIP